MSKRWAATVIAFMIVFPSAGHAIPSITASLASIAAGTTGTPIDLFFNVFPGDTVTSATAQIVAAGQTTFDSNVNVDTNGAPTIGVINSAGPGDARAGYVFGPNCGSSSCLYAAGAYHFATLTISTSLGDGATGAGDLVLESGTFVQAPFCAAAVANEGETLVTVTSIPEPKTGLLLGGAVLALAVLRRFTD